MNIFDKVAALSKNDKKDNDSDDSGWSDEEAPKVIPPPKPQPANAFKPAINQPPPKAPVIQPPPPKTSSIPLSKPSEDISPPVTSSKPPPPPLFAALGNKPPDKPAPPPLFAALGNKPPDDSTPPQPPPKLTPPPPLFTALGNKPPDDSTPPQPPPKLTPPPIFTVLENKTEDSTPPQPSPKPALDQPPLLSPPPPSSVRARSPLSPSATQHNETNITPTTTTNNNMSFNIPLPPPPSKPSIPPSSSQSLQDDGGAATSPLASIKIPAPPSASPFSLPSTPQQNNKNNSSSITADISGETHNRPMNLLLKDMVPIIDDDEEKEWDEESSPLPPPPPSPFAPQTPSRRASSISSNTPFSSKPFSSPLSFSSFVERPIRSDPPKAHPPPGDRTDQQDCIFAWELLEGEDSSTMLAWKEAQRQQRDLLHRHSPREIPFYPSCSSSTARMFELESIFITFAGHKGGTLSSKITLPLAMQAAGMKVVPEHLESFQFSNPSSTARSAPAPAIASLQKRPIGKPSPSLTPSPRTAHPVRPADFNVDLPTFLRASQSILSTRPSFTCPSHTPYTPREDLDCLFKQLDLIKTPQFGIGKGGVGVGADTETEGSISGDDLSILLSRVESESSLSKSETLAFKGTLAALGLLAHSPTSSLNTSRSGLGAGGTRSKSNSSPKVRVGGKRLSVTGLQGHPWGADHVISVSDLMSVLRVKV